MSEEAKLPVTEGGYSYQEVKVPDFDAVPKGETDPKKFPQKIIKIRADINPARIKEDGETYEEYKYRQSIMNHKINTYLKGTPIWNSALLKTYEKEKVNEFLKQQQTQTK